MLKTNITFCLRLRLYSIDILPIPVVNEAGGAERRTKDRTSSVSVAQWARRSATHSVTAFWTSDSAASRAPLSGEFRGGVM